MTGHADGPPPTLHDVIRTLQGAAAGQASTRAHDVEQHPGTWPSIRESADLMAGLEIAEAVLRDRNLLDGTADDAYRTALGVLNTAAIAVAFVGRSREADALQGVRRAVGAAIERHYLPAAAPGSASDDGRGR